MTINMELAKELFGEDNVRVYDNTFNKEWVLSILSEESPGKIAGKLLHAFSWAHTQHKYPFCCYLYKSLIQGDMGIWLKEGRPLFQQIVTLEPVLSLEEML